METVPPLLAALMILLIAAIGVILMVIRALPKQTGIAEDITTPGFADGVQGLGDIASYHAGNLTDEDSVLRCISELAKASEKLDADDERRRIVTVQFQRIRRSAEKVHNVRILSELDDRGI